MRVGLKLLVGDELPHHQFVAYAREAEELGYESLWLQESWGREAFALLGFVAAHTRRIGLATGIVNVYSRTPTLLAQAAASLDELSGGRFVLGLGVSGPIVIEQWHGVPYNRPLRRTREYVEIIRLVLSGERVSFDGRLFHLSDFRLRFKPLRPTIPIYIAALGPQNLELTGEVADGWLATYVGPGHLAPFRARIAVGARRAGRDPATVDLATQVLACVSDDRSTARALVRQHVAYYVGGMGTFYAELMKRQGYADVVAQVRACWARGDRGGAAAALADEMLDEIAIIGEPEECRARLRRYHEHGVGLPILYPPHGASASMIARTMRELAPSKLT